MVNQHSKKRTPWDPALGVMGKVVNQHGLGVLNAHDKVLEMKLLPSPLGPHFFGQLTFHLGLQLNQMILNFKEFTKASDDASYLSSGVGSFRSQVPEHAFNMVEAFGALIDVDVPERAPGTQCLVPVLARYYGLVQSEDVLWSTFVLSFDAGLGAALGMRVDHEGERVQWFLPETDKSKTVLMWELTHALCGVRCDTTQLVDVQTPLLKSVGESWCTLPECDVKVDAQCAWFLGGSDDDNTTLWRASFGQAPEPSQHLPGSYVTGAFAQKTSQALVTTWVDDGLRWFLLALDSGTYEEVTARFFEPSGDMTMVLSPDGQFVAALDVGDDTSILTVHRLSDGGVVDQVESLFPVDVLWSWLDRGIHLSGEDESGHIYPQYWQPYTPWRYETSHRLMSPDGQFKVQYRSFGIESSSWRRGYVSLDDFYDLSSETSYSFDMPRWLDARWFVYFSSTLMAIDVQTGKTQTLLEAALDEEIFDVHFDAHGHGVLVTSTETRWFERTDTKENAHQ